MRVATLITLTLALTACGGRSLTPANVAPEPGGNLAVSFTRQFPPGFWSEGEHAYRMVITCPTQQVGPPVVRFTVSADAPRVDTVYLRFDGPGTNLLSPADLASVHPDDSTVAAVTLAGMTEEAANEAIARCHGTVVYDGLDPEPLEPGTPFSP
jgi:hypothetical protein